MINPKDRFSLVDNINFAVTAFHQTVQLLLKYSQYQQTPHFIEFAMAW